MDIEKTLVTPEQAQEWLEKCNTRNRNLNETFAKALARDMTKGHWQEAGDTIRFAADGTLLDGQHRLRAIVLSGCTIPMLAVRGLAEKTQIVMDTGRKRSFRDQLVFNGETNTSLLAAVAKFTLALTNENGTENSNAKPTDSEMKQWIEENPGIRQYIHWVNSNWMYLRPCPPSVAAHAYYRCAQIDPYAAAEFFEKWATRTNLTADDPIAAMARRLTNIGTNKQKFSRSAYLSLIFRTWNAWRGGETQTKIFTVQRDGTVRVPEPK